MRIQFALRPGLAGLDIPRPEPASHNIPDWFRRLSTEIVDNDRRVVVGPEGKPVRTVKACVPFLDALTAGYTIPLAVDVGVRNDPSLPGGKSFNWGALAIYSDHSAVQVGEMPRRMPGVGKWVNVWTIRTPPGYSCLFVPPLNRDLPFRCFSGVVDTDNYENEVNFPFDWTEPGFEGVVDAGTPLVQCIPFRREAWKHAVLEPEGKDAARRQERSDRARFMINSRLYDAYKRRFWHRKEFK